MNSLDHEMLQAMEFDSYLEERKVPALCECGHSEKDHAKQGPKPPHPKSALYSKQLAATIQWKVYPEMNGPYTLFPTSEMAYCEVCLCSCIDFKGAKMPTPKEVAEQVYNLYPRKVARRAALKAIQHALNRVHDGEVNNKPMTWEDAYKFLITKTRQYADSPAGNRESLTPYPATFFNQSRYLDHEIEWHRMSASEVQEFEQQTARRNSLRASEGMVWRPQ